MKVTVVLNLNGTSNVQVCVDADMYCDSITASNNLNFVEPAVSAQVAANMLAQVNLTRISANALRSAIAAPISALRTDNIHVARAAVDSNLKMLGNLVENVANAPNILDINREAIARSAGMKVKSHVGKTVMPFTASNLKTSGSVRLVASGGASAHLWAYTIAKEDFVNHKLVEPTTKAYTEIDGLTSGLSYCFYHKPISNKGPHPWEGPEYLLVT